MQATVRGSPCTLNDHVVRIAAEDVRLVAALSGASQKKMASAIRVNRSTISRWMTGEYPAPIATAYRHVVALTDAGMHAPVLLASACSLIRQRALSGWSLENLEARSRELWQETAEANHDFERLNLARSVGVPVSSETYTTKIRTAVNRMMEAHAIDYAKARAV